MKVFILIKGVYTGKLVDKVYLKTCESRKEAEDSIKVYLGSLGMRCCVNMQVCRPLPNHWITRDYDNDSGLLLKRVDYMIKEVEL